jgi:PAS domain S-box-containing protein
LITDNKKESNKNKAKSLFQTLIEKSNDAILVVSGEKIVYANQVTTTLCGYDKPEEIIGKNGLLFISPTFRKDYTERIKSRQAGNPQVERFEHEIVRRDGSIVPVETTASLVEYEGKPAVLFISRDITEKTNFIDKLIALHKFTVQIGKAQSLVDISEPTLNAITTVMGFKLANFMLREETHLGCVHDVGYESPYWHTAIDGEGGISLAAREARTVIVNDANQIVDHLQQYGIQSELATPILANGRVEAVLSIESKEKAAFLDSDAQILEIIAQYAGSALERIDLT